MLSRLAIYGGHVPAASIVRGFATTASRSARFGGGGSSWGAQGIGIRTKAGPTLRERLLGPTSGKPFIYGTYAIAGASVFGVGMLCYYGLTRQGMSAMDRAALWSDMVRTRLHSTYAYLGGSLALTAGAAMAAARSPAIMTLMSGGGLVLFIGSMAAIIGSGYLVRSIDYSGNLLAKHAAWMAHTALLGVVLAPLCLAGGPVLLRAAWYTAGLCAGLTATALCAPSEKFLMMSGPLAMGLGVVFVANIGSFIFPPSSALGASLAAVVVYGGLILFSGFLLYDTQRIIRQAEQTPESQTQTFYNQYGQPVQTVAIRGFDPINAQHHHKHA